ncbi:MAG: hypothetical protein QM645_06350 [Asticcacaulis sp.]
MPSLLDIVVSFLAALLSAAFLHFGAAEKPEDSRHDTAHETAALSLTETVEPENVSAAVSAQTSSQKSSQLPNMKFLAY